MTNEQFDIAWAQRGEPNPVVGNSWSSWVDGKGKGPDILMIQDEGQPERAWERWSAPHGMGAVRLHCLFRSVTSSRRDLNPQHAGRTKKPGQWAGLEAFLLSHAKAPAQGGEAGSPKGDQRIIPENSRKFEPTSARHAAPSRARLNPATPLLRRHRISQVAIGPLLLPGCAQRWRIVAHAQLRRIRV